MELQNNQRGNLMNEITNIVEKTTLLKQDIELSKLIYTIRGKQIMLDCDLAILYGYCRLPRLLTQQGLTTIERVDDAG